MKVILREGWGCEEKGLNDGIFDFNGAYFPGNINRVLGGTSCEARHRPELGGEVWTTESGV